MDATTNSLNWFEIPATDLDRARHFYQVAFSIHMREMEIMGMRMATFPSTDGSGKVSGGLTQGEQNAPAAQGTMVYLNANPDMTPVIERIEAMGGQLLLPKTAISPEMGFMAIFIDSEGNKVGLHSLE